MNIGRNTRVDVRDILDTPRVSLELGCRYGTGLYSEIRSPWSLYDVIMLWHFLKVPVEVRVHETPWLLPCVSHGAGSLTCCLADEAISLRHHGTLFPAGSVSVSCF